MKITRVHVHVTRLKPDGYCVRALGPGGTSRLTVSREITILAGDDQEAVDVAEDWAKKLWKSLFEVNVTLEENER